MKTLTIIVIFLLLSCVIVASPPTLSIPFGGLNDTRNPLMTQAGEAEISLNWDYSKNFGSITKRDGCSLYVQRGNTSLQGITSFINNQGYKRLFAYAKTMVGGVEASPWNYIYFSKMNDKALLSVTAYYQYKDVTPSWLQYNNMLICANGKNRPIRFTDSSAAPNSMRPLTEVPIGYLDLAPINTSNRPCLNGDYYYAMRISRPVPSDTITKYWPRNPDSMNLTNLTWNIHVDSDQVAIYNFPRLGYQTLYSVDTISCDTNSYWHYLGGFHFEWITVITCDTANGGFRNYIPDYVMLQIGRTRAGKAYNDSFFLVGQRTYLNNANDTASILDYIIDSIPDENLGTTSHKFIGFMDTLQHIAVLNSGATVDTAFKAGSPTWLGTITIDTAWRGIAHGMRQADSVWKWTDYCIVLYDTTTGMVTDTGPVIRIPVKYKDATIDTLNRDTTYDYAIRLGIPPEHPNNRWLKRLLARRRVNELKRTDIDTIWFGDNPAVYLGEQPTVMWGMWGNGIAGVWAIPFPRNRFSNYGCVTSTGDTIKGAQARQYLYFDTKERCVMCRENPVTNDSDVIRIIAESWYVVDTLDGSDSAGSYLPWQDGIYVDSIPWSDLEVASKGLMTGWVLGQANYPTILNNRIYMASKNTVMYSAITANGSEPTLWYPENRFFISDDDKDEITGLRADGNRLEIFRNHSIWMATQTASGIHQVECFVRGIGCVASKSIIDIPGGGYGFLSENGIYLFSTALQSPYKESGGNLPKISDDVQNHLDKYSLAVKRECYAWFTPDNRNLVFSFPTIDTSLVYSLPTGEWNVWPKIAPRQGTMYTTTIQSDMRPMDTFVFIKNNDDYVFRYGGTKKDSGQAITATWESQPLFVTNGWGRLEGYGLWRVSNASLPIFVTLYNQGDTSVFTKTDSTQYRYRYMSANPKEAMYYKFKISSSADSLTLQKLDLWYKMITPLQQIY